MGRRKKNKIPPKLVFENGQPCGEDRCGRPKTRLPCKFCGRVRAMGKSIIKVRVEHVHMERLTEGNINRYLEKENKEEATLRIWLAPGTDITEHKNKD